MAHVFISYSHIDEDLAFALNNRLKEAKIETFIDQPSISPGIEWLNKLKDALDDSFAVLVVCTKSSMSSHEVTFEWSYAMGQGILVIPLVYEENCELHSRLHQLQHLDFSRTRDRAWDKLVNVLVEARTRYKPTSGYLAEVGIKHIYFSRDELNTNYAISKLLQQLAVGAELLIVSRSCEAWAREYFELAKVINEKDARVTLVMVDPTIPQKNWMIPSDYAKFDVEPTIRKLEKIDLNPQTKGYIELRFLPSSPLFSFVHFMHENNYRVGILEAGASLQLDERVILMFESSNHSKGVLLERLYTIYRRVADESTVAYTKRGSQNGSDK